MTGLLWRRFTLRHWRQAPLQSAVLVLILALGIGVFFAMRLANRAVLASFESFTELIKQESDWVLTSPAGSLPETHAARSPRAARRPARASHAGAGDHRDRAFAW